MRHTLRLWHLVLAIALIVPGSAVGVLAQSSDSSAAGNVVSPQVGDTVSYISESGCPLATLTCTNVIVGWDEFDSYYAPAKGMMYVAVVVDVANLGTRGSLSIRADDFRLQDVDGFFYSRSWADGKDNATYAPTEGEVSVGAGSTESVVLVYEVLDGVQMDRLCWMPDFDRMLTIADLSTIDPVPAS